MSFYYDERNNIQNNSYFQHKISNSHITKSPFHHLEELKFKTPKTIQIKTIQNNLLITGDRFIPLKNDRENFQNFLLQSSDNNLNSDSFSPSPKKIKENYSKMILNSLLVKNEDYSDNKINNSIYNSINVKLKKQQSILSFSQRTRNTNSLPFFNSINNFFQNNNFLLKKDKKRYISKTVERMIEAPDLSDNFYLNLLDWGSKNILSIGLLNEVHLLNTETFQTELLTSLPYNIKITSLSWINSGTVLSIGTEYGEIQLYDIIKLQKIRTMSGNYERISSLNWNNFILSSGGKDKKIINHDVRKKNHIISQLKGHKGEICQLKYNNDGILLASGGNDNLCLIWDVRYLDNKLNDISYINENKPLITLNYHLGAVKGISWCPWIRNFIATGGGNHDQSIKFFNVDNNNLVNCINTGSQVCSLLWNKREKELISSHGFNKNYICIWDYRKMNKVVELKGHTKRVLYLTISPDECFIASAAADDTLRFWRINDKIDEISKEEDDDLFFFSQVR